MAELASVSPSVFGAPDQAAGLRALFGKPGAAWEVLLQLAVRHPDQAQNIAEHARERARTGSGLMVVDLARAQVGLALGLRQRYDLDHALSGECRPEEVCGDAGEGLFVLPAARALDNALADPAHGERLIAAIGELARTRGPVLLIMPAARMGWLATLPSALRPDSAELLVPPGRDAAAAVLSSVRIAASEAHIGTFHLFFPGLGIAAAGRLHSGLAAIARRHFGVRLLAVRPGTGPGQNASPGPGPRERSL
jgi:hypothetical protein